MNPYKVFPAEKARKKRRFEWFKIDKNFTLCQLHLVLQIALKANALSRLKCLTTDKSEQGHQARPRFLLIFSESELIRSTKKSKRALSVFLNALWRCPGLCCLLHFRWLDWVLLWFWAFRLLRSKSRVADPICCLMNKWPTSLTCILLQLKLLLTIILVLQWRRTLQNTSLFELILSMRQRQTSSLLNS